MANKCEPGADINKKLYVPAIPFRWLFRYKGRSVNAVRLAQFIWFKKITKKTDCVSLRSGEAEHYCYVTQRHFSTALKELESVGMVKVVWCIRKSPKITVINYADSEETSKSDKEKFAENNTKKIEKVLKNASNKTAKNLQ
jgi:hypothetical protein